jgi:hypothetical protein
MIKAKVFLVLSILLASCSGNDSNNMVPSSLPTNPSNVTASTNVSGSVITNDLDISINALFCPVNSCEIVYENDEFPSFRKIFYRLEFTVFNKNNTNRPLSISIKIPNSSDIQIINKTHNSGAPDPNIPPIPTQELIDGRLVDVTTITGISYTAQPGSGSFFYVFEMTGLRETPSNIFESSYVNRVINNQFILLQPVRFRFVGSIPKLVQPTLSILGNEVRWDHSPLNLPRYDVQINSEEKQISLNTNKISIDHLASGNHTIKVTSKGDGFTFRNSDESILNFSKISAPTVVNSIINNEKMISWQAISGATSYEISNGISKRQTNDLTIKLTDVISTEGTFNLSVISMSSTQNIAQSSQSNVIVAIKLNAPIINKINAGLIRWSEVPNATGYIVINNGIVSETITSLEWNLQSGPNSNVQVMAISSLPNVLDSGWSNNINYNLG